MEYSITLNDDAAEELVESVTSRYEADIDRVETMASRALGESTEASALVRLLEHRIVKVDVKVRQLEEELATVREHNLNLQELVESVVH